MAAGVNAEPTTGRLLEGVVATLESVVLPELQRGSAARRQLNAAIDILRRLAFSAPRLGASIGSDNADIAQTLRDLVVWASPDGADRIEAALAAAEAEADREARHGLLNAALTDVQSNIEHVAMDHEAGPEIARRLRALYRRMLDRELALIPPSRHGAGGPG
jgi:hypothetical protein